MIEARIVRNENSDIGWARYRIVLRRMSEMDCAHAVLNENTDMQCGGRPEQKLTIRAACVADRQHSTSHRERSTEHQRAEPARVRADQHSHTNPRAEELHFVHTHRAYPQRMHGPDPIFDRRIAVQIDAPESAGSDILDHHDRPIGRHPCVTQHRIHGRGPP
ncbi:hypothetical protein TS71_24545 [Mycolicibacterium neoaurum]|uniref:Uncharacterized protein n=1 Tax=Mycolicibacterium neoaurum VKM Ac-1815D TaxID=700508 RepID=V5XJP8_MYCNE|nr:hypothetical protein D174_12730 [Mycolicibacterium neoaurum VKM Ac-1815D]AMO05869.1 hypothetical protein MyAD_12490 [Mycolicibacterium neoaurum]AXK75797.1 hypothetical protein DXK33_12505 [Mycolicibacterium neoaurum]KJQ47849.1 hypothetical protein TS71_24545 [Mycolicibacterium neoaurum]KUM05885.1 hypothetical protein AVZ31_24455 [Mycolicibacterium neoaurum]